MSRAADVLQSEASLIVRCAFQLGTQIQFYPSQLVIMHLGPKHVMHT